MQISDCIFLKNFRTKLINAMSADKLFANITAKNIVYHTFSLCRNSKNVSRYMPCARLLIYQRGGYARIQSVIIVRLLRGYYCCKDESVISRRAGSARGRAKVPRPHKCRADSGRESRRWLNECGEIGEPEAKGARSFTIRLVRRTYIHKIVSLPAFNASRN